VLGRNAPINVELNKAQAFIRNSYGQNSYYGASSVVTSAVAVPKLHPSSINSEALAVKDYAMTYTNIT